MQCCTCSKLIHSRCSLLSFSRFKTLGSSLTFGAVLLAAFLVLLEVPHLPALCFLHQACLPPLLNLAHPGFCLQMQRTYPIFVFKHSTLFPPTLYFLPLNFPYPLIFLTAFLPFLVSLFLLRLTRSGFFTKMPEVFEPGALKYYTLSRSILWISFVSRNPTLLCLPLFRSLDTLLCDLMTLTPGLAFFLSMTRTLAVALSFMS